MTVTSHSRGHPIYWKEKSEAWFYTDNDKPVDDRRPCALCKEPPTSEGYDPCLGYIEGADGACCGHGIEDSYSIFITKGKKMYKIKKNWYKLLVFLGMRECTCVPPGQGCSLCP